MKAPNRHIFKHGPRFFSLILVVLLLAGLFPIVPARPVRAEKSGTDLPPIGHYYTMWDNDPRATLHFDTDEDFITQYMESNKKKDGDARELLKALEKGSVSQDAVDEFGKLLMLDAASVGTESNWSELLRGLIDTPSDWLSEYGDYNTVLTLADDDVNLLSFGWIDDASNAFSAIGLTLGIYDLVAAEGGSAAERDAALELFNSSMGVLVGNISEIFPSLEMMQGPLSIALIGLVSVDSALKNLYKAGVELDKKAMGNIYYYYNEVWKKDKPLPIDLRDKDKESLEGAWNMGQWRDAFIEIIDENAEKSPEKIVPEMEKLIDDYCERFWKLDIDLQLELEDNLDMRTPLYGKTNVTLKNWDSRRNKRIRKEITEEYKAFLKSKLQPVNASLRNHYMKQIIKDLKKTMNDPLKPLNKRFGLKILQEGKEVDGKTVYPYDGYIVRLKHIDPDFRDENLEEMTVTLKGRSTSYVEKMTVFGHMLAGGGLDLAFWEPDQDPDKDEPAFVETIEIKKSGQAEPIELEDESVDLEGKYTLKLKGEPHEGRNDANINSVSDRAGLLFSLDIFASHVNNIGQKASYGVELVAGKNDSYELIYTAKQGETKVRYRGKKFAYDSQKQTLKGSLDAEVSDEYSGERSYVMEFDLKADPEDPDTLKGKLKISRNKKLFAEYDITLKRKK